MEETFEETSSEVNYQPNSNATQNSNGLNASPPSMQITSDEINFLVYRYLQEAGAYSLLSQILPRWATFFSLLSLF